MKKAAAVIITTILISILLSGVLELPTFGEVNNEVMKHYIEKATEETGAMNIVTGIILDYRAFDTFVEASVLFTAAIIVIMILRQDKQDSGREEKVFKSTILREVGRVILTFIQIFGIYIIFFGHLSPGGGFAGGTILGASLILHSLVHEGVKTQKRLNYRSLIRLLCAAITAYGLLKGYSFIIGGSHLPGLQPGLGTPGNIISGGFLLPLNILVGIIVSITMYFFYTLFDRGDI